MQHPLVDESAQGGASAGAGGNALGQHLPQGAQRSRAAGRRALIGERGRLSRDERAEMLGRILSGDAGEATSRHARLCLLGDVLSDLIGRAPSRSQEYVSLYRSSPYIRELLIAVHREFSGDARAGGTVAGSRRKSFGPGMFTGEQGRLNCVILTRYVLEERLGMSFAEVMQTVSFRLLYKERLRCAKVCFSHLAELLIATYPEKDLKPYYFKNYRGMWYAKGRFRDDLAREALCEFVDILVRSDRSRRRTLKSLPRWLTFRMFQEQLLPYGRSLSYLLGVRFRNSHIDAVMFAYPELKLRPHYFRHVPRRYWQGPAGKARAREAIQEFMDILTDRKGKYKFTRDEALKLVRFTTLQKPVLPFRKRLGGMLRVVYANSAPAARRELRR